MTGARENDVHGDTVRGDPLATAYAGYTGGTVPETWEFCWRPADPDEKIAPGSLLNPPIAAPVRPVRVLRFPPGGATVAADERTTATRCPRPSEHEEPAARSWRSCRPMGRRSPNCPRRPSRSGHGGATAFRSMT